MRFYTTTLLIVSILAAAGCQKASPAAPSPAAPSPAATTPAPSAETGHKHATAADVVPGSHEDWCPEHKVPESMCTRCNATLIPAFKATGDWCPEHGLPESQCLRCNPDIEIVRPSPSGAR